MEHSEELVIDHIQRIQRLEDRMTANENLASSIDENLKRLTNQIYAIKWLVAGGVSFFVAHEIGLTEFLKLVVGAA